MIKFLRSGSGLNAQITMTHSVPWECSFQFWIFRGKTFKMTWISQYPVPLFLAWHLPWGRTGYAHLDELPNISSQWELCRICRRELGVPGRFEAVSGDSESDQVTYLCISAHHPHKFTSSTIFEYVWDLLLNKYIIRLHSSTFIIHANFYFLFLHLRIFWVT